ncbi:hypothetical protein N665_0008s0053 [Sinapis alba]|nr:hypothetical protein N665_0008s0053 [Sinapis alba]
MSSPPSSQADSNDISNASDLKTEVDQIPHPSDDDTSDDDTSDADPLDHEPEINQIPNPSDDGDSDADPVSYFQNVSLRFYAAEPLRIIRKHEYFMALCLGYNNPEAHYIKGLNLYFFYHKPTRALEHLRQSANGKYDKGTYLCGLLMLCRGNIEEGKELLDTLDWEHTLHKSDSCWIKIQKTLSDYSIPKKARYYINLDKLQPLPRCDLLNTEHLCKNCYYFKRVEQFIYYITHR